MVNRTTEPNALTSTVFPDMDEVLKAGSRLRVGRQGWRSGTDETVLVWLLEFLRQQDLSGLSRGQRSDRTAEVFAFTLRGLFEGSITCLRYQDAELEWTNIIALQNDGMKRLQEFIENNSTALPIEKGDLRISRRPHPFAEQTTPSFESHNLRSGFFFKMAHLLAAHGNRVRVCSGCETLLLVRRKDKRFCSQLCQVKEFLRDKRDKARKEAVQATTTKRRKGDTHAKNR